MLWIRIGFNLDPEPAFFVNGNTDPGFWWKKLEKINIFLITNFRFTYPWASEKNVQATRKVFIPQSSTSKLEFSSLLCIILVPPGSVPVFPMRIRPPKWMRIRIHNTACSPIPGCEGLRELVFSLLLELPGYSVAEDEFLHCPHQQLVACDVHSSTAGFSSREFTKQIFKNCHCCRPGHFDTAGLSVQISYS